MTTSPHTDIAIVGGGLAGMLCAALLSKHTTQTITVFEASAHLGGRARTFDLSGGLCNLGPHALYRGGPLMRALRELGVEPAGASPTQHTTMIHDGARTYPLPATPLEMLTHRHLGARTTWALARALLTIQRRTPLRHAPSLDADTWLRQLTDDDHALAILRMLLRLTTYTHAHEVLRARAAHVQLRRALTTGVTYVDGGWHTMITSLRDICLASGRVTCRTDDKIQRIAHSPHTLTASSGDYRARTIILATPPQTAVRLLRDPHLHDDFAATRAACLDLVLRASPHLPKTILGLHEPLYYSAHSYTAALTPGREDLEVVHVAKYLRAGDSKETREELHSWLDVIRPQWRDALIEARFSPSLKVMNHMPTITQRAQKETPAHLFLVGDWCHDDDELLADAVAQSVQHIVASIVHPHSSPHAS